jgi:phosphohistidine swiveling domain-containing protein
MAVQAAEQSTEHAGGDDVLVVDLADLSAERIVEVGGKAANLGALITAGFDVPPGFCVTTAAYRAVVRGTAVQDGLTTDAAAARAAVLQAGVPHQVTAAIRTAYARWGADVAVAVRSSATAEDLPGASFAGQQDTFLGVVGIEDVLGAVHRCWASLWTDRAVAYRSAQGISGSGVALAVVVQRMVDATVAGVLFTADPVTGRRRQAVIDAAPGLGEAVVSGSVDPDHFVVDTATGAILERRHGATAGCCLTDRQLRTLSELGDRVEASFGVPQDIEWAFDGVGRLWLTQSRPITTLFPQPLRHKPLPADEPRVFFCVSLAQGLHRPITPLGIAAFRLLGSAFLGLAGHPPDRIVDGPGGFAVAAGRVFVDATPMLRSSVGRKIAPRMLDVMEARSAVVLRELTRDERFSVQPGSGRRALPSVARVVVALRLPLVAGQALVSPPAAQRRVARLLDDLQTRPIHAAGGDVRQRVDGVVALLAGALPLAPRVLPAAVVGFAALAVAGRLLRGSLPDGGDADWNALQTVLRGAPDNVTTAMDLTLWALAVEARRDPPSSAALQSATPSDLATRYRSGELPAVLQRGMAGFLARYGQRAVAEIDLGMPRWSEDPTHLFGVLAGYLRLDDEAAAPDRHFREGADEAMATIAMLAARARDRRGGRVRAAAVGFCLRRARALAGLREMPKFLMITAIARARAVLLGIGDELAAAGALADPADVAYLDFDEIVAAASGVPVRTTVAQRRAEYAAELRRRHVPRVLLSDGTEPEAVARDAGPPQPGTLTGTPASAGVVTAIARVVLEPEHARLMPGEILVAPSTDPGWTPLFLTAGGLVMEMGGANSHGAVVAREYGIPAVVGVAGATEAITTGMRLTVDGANGTVVLATDLPTTGGPAAR